MLIPFVARSLYTTTVTPPPLVTVHESRRFPCSAFPGLDKQEANKGDCCIFSPENYCDRNSESPLPPERSSQT